MSTSRTDARSYFGLHVTLGLAIVSLTLWAFGALIDEVLEQAWLVRWDLATAARLHALATPVGTRLAAIVSDAGSPATMFAIAAVGTMRAWRRSRLDALTWIAAIVGGAIVDQVLKHAVHRARPIGSARHLQIDSFSFPSGHAMLATVGLGMVAFAARGLRGRRAVLAQVAAALAALAVGASRIYLGVHFPSDVLGGFLAGGGWLAICLTGAVIAHGRRGPH